MTHAFPVVLERLQLPAFDMSKLVGTFVRHIPADPVPRELKRHLFAIEEKILESQVRACMLHAQRVLVLSWSPAGWGSRFEEE